MVMTQLVMEEYRAFRDNLSPDIPVRKRQERGRALACLVAPYRRFSTEASETTYLVPGSEPWVNYRVEWGEGSCECPDFQNHSPEKCKHLWAVKYYLDYLVPVGVN